MQDDVFFKIIDFDDQNIDYELDDTDMFEIESVSSQETIDVEYEFDVIDTSKIIYDDNMITTQLSFLITNKEDTSSRGFKQCINNYLSLIKPNIENIENSLNLLHNTLPVVHMKKKIFEVEVNKNKKNIENTVFLWDVENYMNKPLGKMTDFLQNAYNYKNSKTQIHTYETVEKFLLPYENVEQLKISNMQAIDAVYEWNHDNIIMKEVHRIQDKYFPKVIGFTNTNENKKTKIFDLALYTKGLDDLNIKSNVIIKDNYTAKESFGEIKEISNEHLKIKLENDVVVEFDIKKPFQNPFFVYNDNYKGEKFSKCEFFKQEYTIYSTPEKFQQLYISNVDELFYLHSLGKIQTLDDVINLDKTLLDIHNINHRLTAILKLNTNKKIKKRTTTTNLVPNGPTIINLFRDMYKFREGILVNNLKHRCQYKQETKSVLNSKDKLKLNLTDVVDILTLLNSTPKTKNDSINLSHNGRIIPFKAEKHETSFKWVYDSSSKQVFNSFTLKPEYQISFDDKYNDLLEQLNNIEKDLVLQEIEEYCKMSQVSNTYIPEVLHGNYERVDFDIEMENSFIDGEGFGKNFHAILKQDDVNEIDEHLEKQEEIEKLKSKSFQEQVLQQFIDVFDLKLSQKLKSFIISYVTQKCDIQMLIRAFNSQVKNIKKLTSQKNQSKQLEQAEKTYNDQMKKLRTNSILLISALVVICVQCSLPEVIININLAKCSSYASLKGFPINDTDSKTLIKYIACTLLHVNKLEFQDIQNFNSDTLANDIKKFIEDLLNDNNAIKQWINASKAREENMEKNKDLFKLYKEWSLFRPCKIIIEQDLKTLLSQKSIVTSSRFAFEFVNMLNQNIATQNVLKANTKRTRFCCLDNVNENTNYWNYLKNDKLVDWNGLITKIVKRKHKTKKLTNTLKKIITDNISKTSDINFEIKHSTDKIDVFNPQTNVKQIKTLKECVETYCQKNEYFKNDEFFKFLNDNESFYDQLSQFLKTRIEHIEKYIEKISKKFIVWRTLSQNFKILTNVVLQFCNNMLCKENNQDISIDKQAKVFNHFFANEMQTEFNKVINQFKTSTNAGYKKHFLKEHRGIIDDINDTKKTMYEHVPPLFITRLEHIYKNTMTNVSELCEFTKNKLIDENTKHRTDDDITAIEQNIILLYIFIKVICLMCIALLDADEYPDVFENNLVKFKVDINEFFINDTFEWPNLSDCVIPILVNITNSYKVLWNNNALTFDNIKETFEKHRATSNYDLMNEAENTDRDARQWKKLMIKRLGAVGFETLYGKNSNGEVDISNDNQLEVEGGERMEEVDMNGQEGEFAEDEQ